MTHPSIGAGAEHREASAGDRARLLTRSHGETPVADLPSRYWLTVAGEPVPKARPRATAINGHARLYTPSTTRKYEDRVRKSALLTWRRPPLSDVAIELLALFVLPVPKSWPKWRIAAALAGEIVPTSKPDLDNLVKSLQDGLNGVVYADDSMIAEKRAAKRYGENPRVDLVLSWRSIPERAR